jgi:hypothetical protein
MASRRREAGINATLVGDPIALLSFDYCFILFRFTNSGLPEFVDNNIILYTSGEQLATSCCFVFAVDLDDSEKAFVSSYRSGFGSSEEGERRVQEPAHRSTDHRGVEAGRKAEDVAREVRVSKHTI